MHAIAYTKGARIRIGNANKMQRSSSTITVLSVIQMHACDGKYAWIPMLTMILMRENRNANLSTNVISNLQLKSISNA